MSKLKEEDKLIAAKTLAFSLSSPIDTFRQNMLTKNRLSFKKTVNGVFAGLISAACITIPCHKTIAVFEENNCCQILAVAFGVITASMIKTPILYNYKRVQIGMKITRKIPMKSLKNVASINLIEDVVEESVKYTISKNRIRNKSSNTFSQTCVESILLFTLSYPFDILKNRGMYGICNLKGSNMDFLSKALHKNLQNILFFQMISTPWKNDKNETITSL